MDNLINILNQDDVVKLFIEGRINKNNYHQIEKYTKGLNSKEVAELNNKLSKNLNAVNKRLENDRLEIAKTVKEKYENIAKEIFNDIGPDALGEIYETARCLNLELTSGVYFLRNLDNGMLKIGYGKDLVQRIKQIQGGFELIGYDENLTLEAMHLCFEPHLSLAEKYFHSEFKDRRVTGEWFDINEEELLNYFLLGDFEGDYIEDVLVSWADYESFNFKPLERDFEISLREMEYELFEKIVSRKDAWVLLQHGVRNKFYQIIKIVERNNIAINAIDMTLFPKLKKKGITTENATNTFDFLGLKANKFNYQKTKKIISEVQNNLKEAR